MQFTLTKKVALSGLVCLAVITAAALIAIASNLTTRNTVRQLSEYTARQVAANGDLNYQVAQAIAKAQVFYYTRKDIDRLDAQRLFRNVQLSAANLESVGAAADILDAQLLAEHQAMLERRQALLDRAQREFANLVQANIDKKDVAVRRSMVAL